MEKPLIEILNRIQSLEPMPQVALRVLELSQRTDVVPRELIGVIQTEPALTSKVLRLTNSAYYGFKRQIASLDEAGNLLGTSALVNLVLTGCTARYFRSTPHGDADLGARRWERSVAQALSASLLARITQGADRHRAYTAGLLQDIGVLVLDHLPADRRLMLEEEVLRGTPRLEAEAHVFGLHHAEVGARLAQRWNFPELLIDTIRCHHAPELAVADPALTSVVHLGSEVVDELEDARQASTSPGYARSTVALAGLGLDEIAIASMHESLARELERARDFVDAA